MSVALIDIHANSFVTISEYEEAYDAGLMPYTITELNNSILTSLPDGLFKNCNRLEFVNLPNVEQIGSSVFYGCNNLKKLYLNKLSVINKPRQFANLSNLSDIIVDNAEILSTATEAFLNCSSLKNIQLKCNSLIPQSAFKNCYSLNGIIINTDNNYSIGSSAFQECSSLEEFNFVNCNEVFDNAFYSCINLKNVDLNYISFLRNQAFMNCYNLEAINFGSKLSSIGAAAFKNCSKLKYIEIPSNISWMIGNYAFESCSELNFVSIDGNPEIGWRAFSGCFNIESIYAPNLKSISSIMIPKSYYLPVVKTLGTDIYYNSSHTVIDISTIEKVSINAFVMWRNDPLGPSDTLELHLPNCTIYSDAFGNFLTKIEMEKLTTISNSYYFAGYRGYAASTYYSNLKLSYVYAPEFRMSNNQVAFDFPNRSASNQGIASCIEVFGCNNTESLFAYSYLNSAPLYPKLSKIFINGYSTSRGWQLSAMAPNLLEIELIINSSISFATFYYIPQYSPEDLGTYLISANYSGSINFRTTWIGYTLSMPYIKEIYTYAYLFNSDYTSGALMYRNSIIDVFNLANLKSIINTTHSKEISQAYSSLYYISPAIFMNCSSLSIISLPLLEQLSNIAVAERCSNLNTVYLPKLSELSLPFLQSCGHIDNINLELCTNNYKSLESSVNTMFEYKKFGPCTEFNNVIYGTYEYNEYINTENLQLPNCVKIDHYMQPSFYDEYYDRWKLRSAFSKGTRHLTAPNCNYIAYYDVRSKNGLLDIELSSYVDYFSFHNCCQLSKLSLKTSSTYVLQNFSLYNMFSLNELMLEASESITFSDNCIYNAVSLPSSSGIYDVELMNISSMNFKASDIYINSRVINKIYYGTGGGTYTSREVSTYFIGDIINIYANNLVINDITGLAGKQMISISANTLSVNFDRLFSPLIILDTPVYVSGSGSIRTNLYYNQHYVFESSIFRVVKVRPSLLSLYKNDEYYMSNESIIQFIEL